MTQLASFQLKTMLLTPFGKWNAKPTVSSLCKHRRCPRFLGVLQQKFRQEPSCSPMRTIGASTKPFWRSAQRFGTPQPTGIDELKSQPENFFDMRNVKRSKRSPDFKHKFKQQYAFWLSNARPDLLLLVKEWDSDNSHGLSKASQHCTHNIHSLTWHQVAQWQA